MIIIMEGPDLSGKSYAIEKVGKHFNSGFTIKNNYKPRTLDDSPMIYLKYWEILKMLKHELFTDNIVILDRFFPSQAVYSYLRGEDEMECIDIKTLDNFCANQNVLYIYIDTDELELEKRYMERGDEHIKFKDIKELKERYDKFFELTKMKKLKIDTRQDGWLNKIDGAIRHILEESK